MGAGPQRHAAAPRLPPLIQHFRENPAYAAGLMTAVHLDVESRWECPNCGATDVTREQRVHTRMHSCRALFGLTAPMVPAGMRCKVETHEREDYIGSEIVQVDGRGRPIMSVVTTRDDGEDCTVFAPLAVAHAEEF